MDVRLKSQWQVRQAENPVNSSSNTTNLSSPFSNAETTIRWTKLGKLSQVLYPTSSPYGRPTVCLCSSKHLLIGTDSADVLVFNYEQQLVAQLSTFSVDARLGEVTCLNVSEDATHVVAGFSQGWVCLWDLEAPPKGAPQLRTAVPPIDPNNVPLPNSRVQGHESHVAGIPLKYVSFLSSKHSTFVSVDVGGLVILHRHHRVLLEHTTKSRRLMGSFIGGTHVLDAVVFGTFVAVLTSQVFMVVQLGHDGIVECLNVPRSKDTKDRDADHGVVRFNHITRQLAYSWGSQLKVLDLDSRNEFTADKAYTHPMPIEWFDWIDYRSGMVVILSSPSRQPQLDLLLVNDAHLVDSEPLSPSAHLLQMQASASTLFALGRYEFSIGQLTNWADRLLALLNNAHPTEAIELALSYFTDEGDMSVLGLPAERRLRQRVVRKAFPDLVLTALRFSVQFDFESLKRLLPTSIRAAVIINGSLLESILELISSSDEQWIHELFLDTLVSLVLSGDLRSLPPTVFKELVINRYTTQQIFYLLDLSGLDLDLAFKICSQHPEMAEVDIYLRNQALEEYLSPLSPPNSHTVGYLALILTGRSYPTGNAVAEESRTLKAKNDIYKALFLAETTTVLQSIINYDEKGFFTALNEAFEDSFLNDSTEINRQVIVNLLRSSTVQTKGVYLPIFLSRNYPKYQQFLILPGQELQRIALQLCEPNDEIEESQLALLSLLSVFKPTDEQRFTNALVDANYTLVLEYFYRKQGKYRELILLKLKSHQSDLWATLEEALIRDRTTLTAVICEHVYQLLAESPEKLAEIVLSHLRDTTIWQDILSIDDESKKFAFLDCIFKTMGQSGGQLPPLAARTAYVSLLAKQPSHGDGELLKVLQDVLTGEDDVQLPLVVDDLLEGGHVDSLALLLCRRNRKTEAMIYVLNYLPSLEGTEFTRYTHIAVSICLEVSQTSREESAQLWRRLLETLIGIETDEAAVELRNVVRALSESGTASTIDIAADLLSSKQRGVISVVSQLFQDLRRQEYALQSLLTILQLDSYKDLVNVLVGRAQGWAVSVDGECEICGRKIVGLGIDADVLYKAWEQSGREEEVTAEIDTLVSFQCHHAYHFQCLSRMTQEDLHVPKLRHCILCDTEP